MCHYPDLSSASDHSLSDGVWENMFWLVKANFLRQHNQSEVICRSGLWHISMELLHSFLWHHSTGKPVMASQNAGCFLRSLKNVPQTTDLPHGKHLVMWFIVSSFYPINFCSIDNTIYFYTTNGPIMSCRTGKKNWPGPSCSNAG